MSWLSKLFGVGGGTDAITAVGNAFDEIFTSDEERAQAKMVMEKLKQQPAALQVELNKVEATHRSTFVAGWRPFIGWVCGFGFGYHYVLQPFLIFIIAATGAELPELPEFDMISLQTVLMGMLGLGGLRTFEKLKGKAK